MTVQSVCIMSENGAENFDNGQTDVNAASVEEIDHFRSFVYGGSPVQCFMWQNSNCKCGTSGTIAAATVVQCLCDVSYC